MFLKILEMTIASEMLRGFVILEFRKSVLILN